MSVRLLVLVGPTAGGKTRLGVDVAHRLRTEIISADSRQVYRGLDIGSGKDLAEYSAVTPPVPYHLIDVADPREAYSVFHYQQDCYRLLEQRDDGPPLLMVGGTGLFVEVVLRGYRIPNVPEDEALRRRLMRRAHAELVEELRSLDLSATGVADLRPLPPSVRWLKLRVGPQHLDLASLGSLPRLRWLDLSWNQDWTDLDGLPELEALEVINLERCKELRDVSALARCPNLRVVGLGHCEPLADVSVLDQTLDGLAGLVEHCSANRNNVRIGDGNRQ